MRHAVQLQLAAFFEMDDVTMYIGPSRTGALLEVGVLDAYGDDAVVIHAMSARRRYLDRMRDAP